MNREQRIAGEIADMLRKSVIDVAALHRDMDDLYYKCRNAEVTQTAELYERIAADDAGQLPSKDQLEEIRERAWAPLHVETECQLSAGLDALTSNS